LSAEQPAETEHLEEFIGGIADKRSTIIRVERSMVTISA